MARRRRSCPLLQASSAFPHRSTISVWQKGQNTLSKLLPQWKYSGMSEKWSSNSCASGRICDSNLTQPRPAPLAVWPKDRPEAQSSSCQTLRQFRMASLEYMLSPIATQGKN